MNERREQAVAAKARTATSSNASRARIGALAQALAELRLAAGAIGHLALELAAGGVDVVAARATHRRDAAGLVEQLLEAAHGGIVRALEGGARERVERDQVDLGRVLHLQPVVELAHQLDQL